MYDEKYRPQFHFTAARNWLNDPNGLVYYKGQYHLFFQHNPSGIGWGNMTWGHAVSDDLVHWRELGLAILPDDAGTIYSGSAVVDWDNTTGFQSGEDAPIVCIYTVAGDNSPTKDKPYTQDLAYSTDGGRTFTKYAGNPVLPQIAHGNRDPKVIFHAPSGKWVMALYIDKSTFSLFGSSNLKKWDKLCDVQVEASSECPDLFELPVDGDPSQTRWVFWAANGSYLLGTFDGTTFQADGPALRSNWGANCYAAQSWSDIPASDGRRLQIAWMNGGKYPDMPFNQQMTVIRELTLRTTPAGVRLFINPAREIERLHTAKHSWSNLTLEAGDNPLKDVAAELVDIRMEIELGGARTIDLVLRGQAIGYDVAGKTLTYMKSTAPLEPVDGRIRLQVLVDRTSVEAFGNDGAVTIPECCLTEPEDCGLSLKATGGQAKIVSMDVYELKSAWEK